MADIVQAGEAFSAQVGIVPVSVTQGELWAADDPLVKGREHLFRPVTVRRSQPVAPPRAVVERTETADAPPAGARTVTRPGSRTGPRRPGSGATSGQDERPAGEQPDTTSGEDKGSADKGGADVPPADKGAADKPPAGKG